MKKLSRILLCLMLIFSLAGCNTKATKLDQPKKETTSQQDEDAWMDEEYFELEDARDEEADYSKYDEKTSVVTGKDKYQTDPVPAGKPNPVEPENTQVDKTKKSTCYLTVSCKTILSNKEDLKPGKESVVPKNGIIYARKEVIFYEGESVFDVLQREMKNSKIHMDYSFSPIYNSNYIKGIHNLYERDCGDTSGWMYCVNGWYPNYGCNRYAVQNKDEIQWNYTCDGGSDLGQNWMD